VNWLGQPDTARFVIILGLIWRWTGYNMVFYLAALQNIDYSSLEAAKIDGANSIKTFFYVTLPQLKPMILLTAIMSTNGTLQLFDESWNLTRGGPAYQSMTMSHYLYEVSFQKNPNFGYASAISYVILILVAVLALVQMRVGDKRD
jgi:lactose/L-arabinose transport system permease protein